MRLLLLLSIFSWNICIAEILIRSKPTTVTTPHGSYAYYAPALGRKNPDLLVVCHGMFAETENAKDAALATLKKWTRFANEHGLYVIAPAFDNENFAVTLKVKKMGGYRSLTGRVIGADVYLQELVDSFRGLVPQLPEQFYLFGHSAGAQFANRYLIRHSSNLKGALLSSPAWYSFPDPTKSWPEGMLPRKEKFQWPTGEQISVDVKPEAKEWVTASQVPTLVIVGAEDMGDLKEGRSENHVSQAKLWVEKMTAFAKKQGAQAKIELLIVPSVGHNLGKLSRASMPFLTKLLPK